MKSKSSGPQAPGSGPRAQSPGLPKIMNAEKRKAGEKSRPQRASREKETRRKGERAAPKSGRRWAKALDRHPNMQRAPKKETNMQRAEIIAKGDVQKVGLRDTVQIIGRDLGLSGIVKNQEPYDVAIVAEGEKDALDKFIAELKVERRAIKVRELEVHWREATGEFPYFKILRGDWQEEMGERFDVAVGILHTMLEKQDATLEKQDASISVMKEIKMDTSEIGTVRKEVSATRKEVSRGSDEIVSTIKATSMEEKYEELRQEIAEIKAAIEDLKAKVS